MFLKYNIPRKPNIIYRKQYQSINFVIKFFFQLLSLWNTFRVEKDSSKYEELLLFLIKKTERFYDFPETKNDPCGSIYYAIANFCESIISIDKELEA